VLDGLGFESRQGQETLLFSEISGRVCGPTQHLLHWYWGSFPGVKWPGREVVHWLPSSAFIAWPRKPLPIVVLEFTRIYILAQTNYLTLLIFKNMGAPTLLSERVTLVIVGFFAGRTWKNSLNYCEMFIVHALLTNVAADLRVAVWRPPV
jgi:hypothetical protein